MNKLTLLLLLLLLVLVPSSSLGQSFFTDRAVGVDPFSRALIPISYGQVRVCGPLAPGSPCTPLASITNVAGNPLTVNGGNFGQLTTDVVGRFTFGCAPGNYLVQVAASSSNTPQLSYNITCSSSGGATFSMISVLKLSRDCRLDGVVADGVTNDSTAVNACITNAYTANQNHVIFPSGNILLNSAVNATNMPSMIYEGAGETFTATPVLTQQTVFFCNTGAVCFDTTGSGEIRLQDLGFRIKNSFSTPSTVDILMGRDAAAGASGTYCFAQNNQLVNVSVWNDHSGTANGGDGYIGLYNVGAEGGWLSSSFFSGDTSLFFTATNVDSVVSPFQTLFTGCAASMSQWTIQQTEIQANSSSGQPAVKTSDAYAFHWNTDSFVGSNNTGFAFATNGSTSTWSMTNIDFEGFGVNSAIFNMNGNVDGLELDAYTGNAGAGTKVIGLGANNLILSNAKIRTRNVTGTAPGLINNNTGTICKNCDIDISGTTNPTAYSNVTISGGIIRGVAFTDTQANNFNASSFYQLLDSTGHSFVGKVNFTSGLTVSSGVTADGSGHKHKRVTGCTTGAVSGNLCLTTVTWTTAFADANYSVSCTLENTTQIGHLGNTGPIAAGSFQINTVTDTNTAISGIVDCTATHD